MDQPRKKQGPKRATDRRRTYAATKVGKVSGSTDTNGAGPPISFFRDRRTGNNGAGKRAV